MSARTGRPPATSRGDVDEVAVRLAAAGHRQVLNHAELRVAISLFNGYTAAEVSQALGITMRTVKRHRAALRDLAHLKTTETA